MISENKNTVRYLAGGTLGEKRVLTALTDIPAAQIKTHILPEYGLRVQPLDKVAIDVVRNDLYKGWNEGGNVPFYGALTLVKAPGEFTPVSLVEVSTEAWNQSVKPRLEEWNYHGLGWFNFEEVLLDTPDSILKCTTEVLPFGQDLQHLPKNFRRMSDYMIFVRTMERRILGYRRNVEGSLPPLT